MKWVDGLRKFFWLLLTKNSANLTEQMHANNEWVSIEDLIQSTKILAHTILDWCHAG